MDVVLERFNFENVEDLLERLGARARPPLVLAMWGEILDDVLVAERRLFQSGRGWKDIKTSTIQRKSRDRDPRVRANNYRTNVGTGALREHMTTRGPGRQPLNLDADELRIGIKGGRSDVFYGVIQEKQGRDPRISRAVTRRITSKRILEHLTAP